MKLQAILDAVLDGVVVLDADGCVDVLNSEACRILETTEKVIGTRVEDLLGPEHPIVHLARGVLAGERTAIQDDIEIERRLTGTLVADAAVAPLFEEDGSQAGAVIVLGDRTIRNSLRDALSEREALASYGHIAAGIAHEVKNPLSGIRGAAELLELRAGDQRARETASLIVREVDRITTLVDELMVFARGEALEPKAGNVHRILDAVLELIAVDPAASAVTIERVYDPSIPEFLADENRLTQIFLNLARNAVQAMDGAPGTLRVTTGVSLDQRLAAPDGHMVPAVTVRFRDEGGGISEKDLSRMSTPFFTTKAKGTGLGLAVTRHWVSQHGGSLDIQSTEGVGTTVRVALLLDEPGRKRSPKNKQPESTPVENFEKARTA